MNWQGKIPTQTTSGQNPETLQGKAEALLPQTRQRWPSTAGVLMAQVSGTAVAWTYWNCQVNIRVCFSEDILSSPRVPRGLQIQEVLEIPRPPEP